MSELPSFHDDTGGFEAQAHENGEVWWWASDLADLLGYQGYSASFKKAIQRAIATCVTLEVPINENFREQKREVGGETRMDYRLTRFACYLVAMNGDVKKERVAEAQAYFLTLADAFRRYVQEAEDIERVLIRDELSQYEKSLASTAKGHGIQVYAFFQNAGYIGLYNMSLNDLKRYKGHHSTRPLLDFMGKEELAANLFRVTQTEAKIKSEEIRGQRSLERAAQEVGGKVRATMIDISGHTPESLPLTTDVKQIRSELKKTGREFKKLDGKKTGKSARLKGPRRGRPVE